MNMYDIIIKKRDGGALSSDELRFVAEGAANGTIPDEQIAAWLMAVYFNGMTPDETTAFTMAMAHSGEMIDLSSVDGVTVDKHSTGGVGDKTTLVVAPIVAACGGGAVKVAKMSGRGLGHTGGTVDKLAAIPGFRTEWPRSEFIRIVNTYGACIVSQSRHLAPADKKLYALRDITGTVGSLPLIAASIMSKKLAAGSDCILLDVKAGSGAFMKTPEEAACLARTMVEIGKNAGKRMLALITGMDRPLGYAIGNALEVIEASETLQGRGPDDLRSLCVTLAGHMLWLAGLGAPESCIVKASEALQTGAAFKTWAAIVAAQGGDPLALTDYGRFPQAACNHTVTSPKTGFIQQMDASRWGAASARLGAGRLKANDAVDYAAGIVLRKKTGDFIRAGEPIGVFYTNNKDSVQEAEKTALNAVQIGPEEPVVSSSLVLARVE